MRQALSRCTPCCPPCPSPDDGCVSTYYSTQGYTWFQNVIIGAFGFINNSTGTAESCISQEDADNKALYAAQWNALRRGGIGVGSGGADWDGWTPRFDNEEISGTANCPCGYTGDPATVTIPAGTYTDYWTPAAANAAALEEAIDQAEDLLECTQNV